MRISRQLAGRIDRLARRAHAFHRHAHHPLCSAYAGELIALGRKQRVCRGCAFALLGSVAGAVLALALPVDRVPLFAVLAAGTVAAFAAGGLAAAGLRAQPVESARPSKLWTRALPATGWSFAAVTAARLPLSHGAPLLLLSVSCVAWAYRAYRARGPARSACERCPERALPVCSGFAPIVRRERAVQRLAGNWIARQG